MKRILIATTMLVSSVGFAAADVTVSGDARMGIVNNGDDTNFSSRARVKFDLTGETDSGLSFGASFRAHQAQGAERGDNGSVFLSGAFGTLTMGNTAGAAENIVGDLNGVGFTGLNDYSDTPFITGDGLENGNGNPILRYDYSAGGFTVSLSTNDGIDGAGNEYDARAIGASYSTDSFSFGLAYEDVSGVDAELEGDHIVASASGTFGGTSVKVVYGTAESDDGDVSFDHVGLGATHTIGLLSLSGFVRQYDASVTGLLDADATVVGVGASYDLGGGAAIKGGVVTADADLDLDGFVETADETIYDLGVTFSF